MYRPSGREEAHRRTFLPMRSPYFPLPGPNHDIDISRSSTIDSHPGEQQRPRCDPWSLRLKPICLSIYLGLSLTRATAELAVSGLERHIDEMTLAGQGIGGSTREIERPSG